jgi:hypothetical protein
MRQRAPSLERQLHLFKSKRQRGTLLPSPLEDAVHIQVAEILRLSINPGWQFTHIASGGYRLPSTAAKLQRMGVQKGWPDLILLSPDPGSSPGPVFFIEFKRARGGRLSDEQEAFRDWALDHGYPHLVTHDAREAVAVLGEWGAIRMGINVQ